MNKKKNEDPKAVVGASVAPAPVVAPKPDKYVTLRTLIDNVRQTSEQSLAKVKYMVLEKQQEIVQKEKELADLNITLHRLEGAQQAAHKILTTPIK